MSPKTFVAFLTCSFTCLALADTEADAKKAISKVTEVFYDQYAQVEPGKAGPWIKQSKHLTPEFKASYALKIKSGYLGADPIINAQDDLPCSVKATDIVVKGETATTTMVLSKPSQWDPNVARVSLVLRGGAWLINGITHMNGKFGGV